MRTPSEDYRWQDHVPSLGSADVAAAIVIAAAFWLSVAIQLPVGGGSAGPTAGAVEAPLAALRVSTRNEAAWTPAGCGARAVPGGMRRVAAEQVDA